VEGLHTAGRVTAYSTIGHIPAGRVVCLTRLSEQRRAIAACGHRFGAGCRDDDGRLLGLGVGSRLPDFNWLDASRPEECGGIGYGELPVIYAVFIR